MITSSENQEQKKNKKKQQSHVRKRKNIFANQSRRPGPTLWCIADTEPAVPTVLKLTTSQEGRVWAPQCCARSSCPPGTPLL